MENTPQAQIKSSVLAQKAVRDREFERKPRIPGYMRVWLTISSNPVDHFVTFLATENRPHFNKRTAPSSDHHSPLHAHIEANLQAN